MPLTCRALPSPSPAPLLPAQSPAPGRVATGRGLFWLAGTRWVQRGGKAPKANTPTPPSVTASPQRPRGQVGEQTPALLQGAPGTGGALATLRSRALWAGRMQGLDTARCEGHSAASALSKASKSLCTTSAFSSKPGQEVLILHLLCFLSILCTYFLSWGQHRCHSTHTNRLLLLNSFTALRLLRLESGVLALGQGSGPAAAGFSSLRL